MEKPTFDFSSYSYNVIGAKRKIKIQNKEDDNFLEETNNENQIE